MKARSALTIAILLLIAVLPWAIGVTFSPLQPPELAQTPTYYAPTEAAYLTREAIPSTTTFSIIGPDGSLTPMATVFESSPKVIAQEAATITLTASHAVAATVTPTILLPIVSQPTRTPIAIRVELTETRALELLDSDFPDLRDPSIEISPDEVWLSGTVGPTGPMGQELNITGTIKLEANKLVMDVNYVALNGQDITSEDLGQQAARAVNLWLQSIQVGQQVQSYEVVEGAVIYDALQSQEPVLPTPIGQEAGATSTPLLIIPDPTPMTVTLQPASNVPLPQATSLGGTQFGTPGTALPTTEGIPIPEAIEVTPTLGTDVAVEATPQEQFTDEDFSGMSLGPLNNVRVSFGEDGMVIVGQIAPGSNAAFPGLGIGGEVVITANLEVRDNHLVVAPVRTTINGRSTVIPGFDQVLTTAINRWLAGLSEGTVETFLMTDGNLTINPIVGTQTP